MTIYFQDILDEDFIERLVPEIIITRVRTLAKDKSAKKMNDYLKKQYNISLEDIINQVKFSTNKVLNKYTLSINDNIFEKETNIRLLSLIKLIDYGNLEIKGINIFNSSMNYIKNNIKSIYKFYQLKGGM